MKGTESELAFHPLTPDRWSDLEQLFGPNGACGGCWCMWWRLSRREFENNQGERNRRASRAIVDSGEVPGILGYEGDRPVAWCSVAPRRVFGSLNRSPVLKPIDDIPVWSIVCLYLAASHRGQRVSELLIRAAVDYAAGEGATVIEAYPTVPNGGRMPPYSSYMGLPSIYEAVGFVECARPSKAKAIMRHTIE